MKTIKIIFAHTFPTEKGKILKNTSNCIFQKNRKRRTVFSDILPTFVAASHQNFSAFFTPGNRIMNASESRLENEFQKSWNKFRKPILILFSITTLSVKVPGIQGSRERTRRVCACVYICVIHTYIFNYVFLNVYILYIRVHGVSVTQSCPTFCYPTDCSRQAPLSMEFSR